MGVAMEDIEVVTGDTGAVSLGLGAFAAKPSPRIIGHVASLEVRNKALKVAAHMLEAAEEDLEIADGRISVRGVSDVSVSLGDVARAAGHAWLLVAGRCGSGDGGDGQFSPTLTYCNGVHVVEVEVDPGTGNVDILEP